MLVRAMLNMILERDQPYTEEMGAAARNYLDKKLDLEAARIKSRGYMCYGARTYKVRVMKRYAIATLSMMMVAISSKGIARLAHDQDFIPESEDDNGTGQVRENGEQAGPQEAPAEEP